MHGHSRLGRSSPPSSPRFRHARTKSVGGGGGVGVGVAGTKLQNILERLLYVLISAMFRRRGVLLFAPLLYISGMLLYMGTLGFDVVVVSKISGGSVAPLGSVYRSPQVFEKLWPFMEAQNNGSSPNALIHAWNPKLHKGWKPCVNYSISQSVMDSILFSAEPRRAGHLSIGELACNGLGAYIREYPYM